jgi:hypothetical protein
MCLGGIVSFDDITRDAVELVIILTVHLINSRYHLNKFQRL